MTQRHILSIKNDEISVMLAGSHSFVKFPDTFKRYSPLGRGHIMPRFPVRESGFTMLLMIDNYDSFTYNVVQYLSELKADVKVVRNDEWSVDDIEAAAPERIVISPGPGTPQDAGISLDVIRKLGGKTPILGICLGHQSIGEAFGAKVVRAGQVMHGKTSKIYHTGKGVFSGLDNPFTATRYHSLVIEQGNVPEDLEITAWTQKEDGSMDEIMGVQHKKLNVHGVQFHPESILTESGHALLKNFLEQK